MFEKLTQEEQVLALMVGCQVPGLLVVGWVFTSSSVLQCLAFMEDILWEVGLICLSPMDLGLLKVMTSVLTPIGFPKSLCLDFSCTRGMNV